MHRVRKIVLAGLFLATAAPLMAEQTMPKMMPKMMYKSTETPAYQVESNVRGLEVRRYAPRIIAEVTLAGSRSAAANDGFRLLADYIFGGNHTSAKVAMTSPVAQAPEKIAMTSPVAQSGDGDRWIVQFTMPSEYRLDTLPKPSDARIRLFEQAGDRQAVRAFSGLASSAVLAAKEAELRDLARAQGLMLDKGPFYYFYDAPFTLPWNRRNEVAFTLK